jgi:Domain of unknown function (DUF4288)
MSTVNSAPESHWYAVRSVIHLAVQADDATQPYEERITLWQAASFTEALERAEAEAVQYAEALGADYLIEFGQAFELFDEPGDGAEVFSLIRDSKLSPPAYVRTFFQTGAERHD